MKYKWQEENVTKEEYQDIFISLERENDINIELASESKL